MGSCSLHDNHVSQILLRFGAEVFDDIGVDLEKVSDFEREGLAVVLAPFDRRLNVQMADIAASIFSVMCISPPDVQIREIRREKPC